MKGNNAKAETITNQELTKMEETTFEAKPCGVSDVKFPFVKAAFRAKDGNVYMGEPKEISAASIIILLYKKCRKYGISLSNQECPVTIIFVS